MMNEQSNNKLATHKRNNRQILCNFYYLKQGATILFTNDLRKKIDKFTHSAIQNKCLKLMCVSILRNISKAVKQSIFYTVMVNEVTYISDQKTFVFAGYIRPLTHMKI